MGYDNENAVRVVFDIETAPLPEASEYLEPVDAPANYKDPAKIDAYIAEKQAENLGRCGLDVDLCQVVAIGWQSERDETPLVMHQGQGVSEQRLIDSFWHAAGHLHLVGFNCISFDLPVLLRRSLYLGIPRPGIHVSKFRHPQITDLLQALTYDGLLKMRGLSFYAKRFGCDVADDLSGADIAQAVKEGRWHDVEAHCKADIQKTAFIAEKLGVFRPQAVMA